MAASRKKLVGTIREILRTWHHVEFDGLPEAYRLTLLAAAETASRMRSPDVNWAVEECWIGLRDTGLGRVVSETIAYYFPDVVLSDADRDSLLVVARDADKRGLNVRAMVEEAWREKQTAKLGDG
jgi:hypothetical protein